MRDMMSGRIEKYRLFPYAKDLHYTPSGILSMTLEMYDENQTHEYTFGFQPGGQLKDFLDKLYSEDAAE